MSLIDDLKACIRRLVDEAENYTDGAACCFCDWEEGEEDEDGDPGDIIHAPDCPAMMAEKLLEL